jgi:hypothetical protein
VNSEEFERNLARLTKLAAAARNRFEDLGRDLEALRRIIEELGAAPAREPAAPQEKKAANGTLDPKVAQVEVVTK